MRRPVTTCRYSVVRQYCRTCCFPLERLAGACCALPALPSAASFPFVAAARRAGPAWRSVPAPAPTVPCSFRPMVRPASAWCSCRRRALFFALGRSAALLAAHLAAALRRRRTTLRAHRSLGLSFHVLGRR